jgi:hypothetical protein
MRNHCAGVLLLMALTACSGANGTSGSSAVAAVAAQETGKQYRAVCTEVAAHGGNYVLSRWLDARDKAVALGEYHSNFKDKGHRVIYEERVKPQTNP